jgi:hypothetical protein
MNYIHRPEGDWNPAQPTEDLAVLALGKLVEGDTGFDFSGIAGHLQRCVAEPHAITEGTLLFAGAEMHDTFEGLVSAITERDATKQRPTNVGSIVAQLDWVEMGTRSRGLRPVGREILKHCIGLSTDVQVTDKLQHIEFLADEFDK